MQDFELDPAALAELKQAHKQCKDKRSAYRINAVYLLGSGYTVREVTEALMLNEKTLQSYVKRYRLGGVARLLKDHYRGGMSCLSLEDEADLIRHLRRHTYQTVAEIVRYVKRQYGVAYTVSGMTDRLHALGFRYKKPKVIPGKANGEAQEAFVERYKKLKENKSPKDPIYFMDGVHPQHNTLSGYGWIERGKEAQIKSNSGRQRLNINGALNIETLRSTVVLGAAVNAATTVELFQRLEAAHPDSKTISVICDNAKYYRSKRVKAYLATSRIELLFLPAYAPNLNLIERYWKFFKKKVIYNRYYETFDEFERACRSFFRRPKRYLVELRSLLTENFPILDAG